MKMILCKCPHCGQVLEVPMENGNMLLVCPACGHNVFPPENLLRYFWREDLSIAVEADGAMSAPAAARPRQRLRR